jgi:hypothetical protein
MIKSAEMEPVAKRTADNVTLTEVLGINVGIIHTIQIPERKMISSDSGVDGTHFSWDDGVNGAYLLYNSDTPFPGEQALALDL